MIRLLVVSHLWQLPPPPDTSFKKGRTSSFLRLFENSSTFFSDAISSIISATRRNWFFVNDKDA